MVWELQTWKFPPGKFRPVQTNLVLPEQIQGVLKCNIIQILAVCSLHLYGDEQNRAHKVRLKNTYKNLSTFQVLKLLEFFVNLFLVPELISNTVIISYWFH